MLQNFEDAVRLSGSNGSNELREFQALLAGQKDSPVTKLIAVLEKHLASQSGATSEPVERLKCLLKSLSGILLSAGAKAPANEISGVEGTLTGDFQSVSQLVEHVLHQSEPAASQIGGGAVRHDLVQSYLDALRNSQSDNAEFDRHIVTLKADKRIRTEEMRELAKQFLGFEIAKKKGREAALKEITNHQAVNARQVARSQSN